MATGIANTPLINYFRYKQSTAISSNTDLINQPILSIADGGNGQLVVTTSNTTDLDVGVAITISATTNYNADYSVISKTATTFNVSGTFGVTETGIWGINSTSTCSTAGEPLDFGKIFFYEDSNKTTLLDTFSDRDSTVPNTNPIVLGAVGDTPPVYLQDIPYYIEIFDKFNNLVATLDNYLPGAASDNPTDELPLGNLFANYGFDVRLNENIYSENDIGGSTTISVSAGWYWQVVTTQISPLNTYSYNTLGNSGIVGNPKNEIFIKSDSNTSGQTVNYLFSIIGDYNAFQGEQLAFSIFTQLSSGATTSLPCSLIRSKNGVDETPIGVGSINITGTKAQQTLIFTVPELLTDDYSNDDILKLAISLPLNEDFLHNYTATWLQISPNGDLAISETAVSYDASKQLLGAGLRQQQTDPSYNERGLPLAIGEGNASVLFYTGKIIEQPTLSNPNNNNALGMGKIDDETAGYELLRDTVLFNTQTNRLIDYLRINEMTQSKHTFIATTVTNIITVKTGIGVAENSTWNSNTGAVTLTKPTNELIYKISVNAVGNGNVFMTFVDNFDASTTFHQRTYTNGGNLWSGTGLPASPMINWIGSYYFEHLEPTNGDPNDFFPFVQVTNINNGSGSTQAKVKLKLPDSNVYNDPTNVIINEGNGFAPTIKFKGMNIYFSLATGSRATANGSTHQASNIRSNFLSYNDISSNVTPQPLTPPRLIRFSVDGLGEIIVGTLSTAIVPIETGDANYIIARALSETINTSFEYELLVNSVPANGDTVDISNDQTDFNLIYYDTALAKPPNPTSKVPIYVEFTTSQTTTDIATSTATAIDSAVMGVPRAADLGLPMTKNLEYFMMV